MWPQHVHNVHCASTYIDDDTGANGRGFDENKCSGKRLGAPNYK